ncbi:hypothetical protein QQF64_007903 [Cirrhinus molitorella]|uniref:Uncharacterized protein n=1 Tax=Cirrhinus molitorella TaxID=172907 RepID=A0ABR3M4L6_9TELE
MKRVLALIPLDVYDSVGYPLHTDAAGVREGVRERAFNHGHEAGAHESERGGGMRERVSERAQADLYLSPSDIFLCCNTQSRGRAGLWRWHSSPSCAPSSENVQRREGWLSRVRSADAAR